MGAENKSFKVSKETGRETYFNLEIESNITMKSHVDIKYWQISWDEGTSVLWYSSKSSLHKFNPEKTANTNWGTAATAAKSLQSCPTLCDPRDSSPPGSPILGILQARVLEWVAISFSRGSSWPKDQTPFSRIADRSFPSEPPGKPTEGKFSSVQFSCSVVSNS